MTKKFWKPGDGMVARSGYAITLKLSGTEEKEEVEKEILIPFKPENISVINVENLNEVKKDGKKEKESKTKKSR